MGGAEYQAKVLTEALVSSGKYRVTWICRYVSAGFLPSGYEIQQLAPPRIFGVANPFPNRYSTDFCRLIKLLRDVVKPDLIYQRVGCAYTGIAARYMRNSGCRMIWHVAREDDVTPEMLGLRPSNLIQSIVEKKFVEYGARHAGRIVVQTRVQQALLQRNHGRTDAVLIPNFHPSPVHAIEKDDIFTVAWVANFKFTKRPEEFVNLAARFSHRRDIRFVMVGAISPSDTFHMWLKERISAMPNVSYLGQLSQDEVNALLGRAHLFVNTSAVEGMPNTFIQAWVRKTPVLSLSVNPDDMLDGGGIGACVGNLAGLVDAVTRLAADREQLRKMGEASALFAREHFSVNNLNRLLELIGNELRLATSLDAPSN